MQQSTGSIIICCICLPAFLPFNFYVLRCVADEILVASKRLVLFHHRSLSAFREDSWFKSLFVRKVDPRKDAHSHLLAKKEDNNLYKIQCMYC